MKLPKTFWVQLAIAALRSLRPSIKLNADQSRAWQAVLDLLETV